MNKRYEFSIEIGRCTAWLLAAVVLLLLAHLCVFLLDHQGMISDDDWMFYAFFDLDEEEAFGTWFSSLLLFVAGLSLLLQARHCRIEGHGWSHWWRLLAIGFFVLSLDEVIGVHEYVNAVTEDTSWTTYAAPIVALVGLAYLPFLASLPAQTRYLFLVAGALYIGAALGVERSTDWYEEQDLLDSLAYNMWTAVEETLEMAGIILFLYALWSYMARPDSDARVHASIRWRPWPRYGSSPDDM